MIYNTNITPVLPQNVTSKHVSSTKWTTFWKACKCYCTP